jgi:hypothetical protein
VEKVRGGNPDSTIPASTFAPTTVVVPPAPAVAVDGVGGWLLAPPAVADAGTPACAAWSEVEGMVRGEVMRGGGGASVMPRSADVRAPEPGRRRGLAPAGSSVGGREFADAPPCRKIS